MLGPSFQLESLGGPSFQHAVLSGLSFQLAVFHSQAASLHRPQTLLLSPCRQHNTCHYTSAGTIGERNLAVMQFDNPLGFAESQA